MKFIITTSSPSTTSSKTEPFGASLTHSPQHTRCYHRSSSFRGQPSSIRLSSATTHRFKTKPQKERSSDNAELCDVRPKEPSVQTCMIVAHHIIRRYPTPPLLSELPQKAV